MEKEQEHVFTSNFRENAIEWYTGQDTITISLTQKRLINKVLKLNELYPEEVRILKINDDGSLYAHIPLRYLNIRRPRELSEEEKQQAAERLAKYRK